MNILNKLTIKHLTMNKKRTVVTIIGVLLSTALMVGIGLLLSTFREMMINEAISYKGNYHVSFTHIDSDKIDIIKNNSNVDYAYTSSLLGYSQIKDNSYEYKPYYKVLAADDNYFKELTLKKGRLPKNDQEIVISSHLEELTGIKHNIGDTLDINLSVREADGNLVTDAALEENEVLKEIGKKVTYHIVGIVDRDKYESYSDPGFSIFTYGKDLKENTTIYLRYKKPNKAYDITENIAKTLDLNDLCSSELVCYDEVGYNDSLLSLYGASQYDNIGNSLGSILTIMLSIVSVGCIIVIYNSFAISVMERKKQFGLFSSIGATKSQLRKTVFFEAIIISVIGIPLGILSAYIGIGVVISIMNNLLTGFYDGTFHLCTYPIFIIIPVIFMIVTIFVSAFLPARKASKITPIEAIRLNDDIKIKGKKIKTPKFINKLFGIEGVLALKNIKRNKKKYRITIASLFISIVMFIFFSGFLTYAFRGTESYVDIPSYDFAIGYDKDKSDINSVKELKGNELVDEVIEYSFASFVIDNSYTKMFTTKYSKFMKDRIDESSKYSDANIVVMNDEDFKSYLNELGFKESKPVLFNRYQGINYNGKNRKSKIFTKYDINTNKVPLKLYDQTFKDDGTEQNELQMTISDYYISSEENMVLSDYTPATGAIIIMSETDYFKTQEYYAARLIVIKSNDVKKLDDKIDGLIENDKLVDAQNYNLYENYKMINNLILMLKILVYGFIALVTLIGVTSVFNTINTSIALRRKEFAMLRSMGLTPKGFNKILYFESIFVGLKSLLYALPCAFGLILLLHFSMSDVVEFEGILIPYISVLISIVGVFIIVLITMMYASSKIKHENILDAIREENI